jgi:hypothetical protein
MLILKLTLVPFFLALVSLAGKRYGPHVAGWLAGLPVVVGPILFLLALESGPQFAGAAAVFTLASVVTVITFGVAYSWAARKYTWMVSLAAALVAWLISAAVVAAVPFSLAGAALAALGVLLVAPRLYPALTSTLKPAALPHWELALRMACGAALTLAVTAAAMTLGPTWSGIAALAPVLTPVIAVFMHRAGGTQTGGPHAIAMLTSLARGLYALAAFCAAVASLLPTQGVAVAFGVATGLALAVQTLTGYLKFGRRAT